MTTANTTLSAVSDDVDSGSGGPEVMYYVYTVGEVIIAVLAMFGNGVLIVAIVRHRRLHTTTNVLIISLAAADLLVGALGIPCALLGFHGLPPDAYGCLLVNTAIVALTQISIFGLLIIAVERFVAIAFPFVYTEWCTVRLAIGVCMTYWLLAIAVGFVPVFGWNLIDSYKSVHCAFMEIIDMHYMVYFNFFACVLIPLFIMLAVYCYILIVVQRQMKQIASLQIGAASNSSQSNSSGHNFKRELKAAKWFAAVIGFFAVCWLPIHLINTLGIYGMYAPIELLVFSILLSHLNSAVNPVLYGFSNSKFKVAVMQTLRCGSVSVADFDSVVGASHATTNMVAVTRRRVRSKIETANSALVNSDYRIADERESNTAAAADGKRVVSKPSSESGVKSEAGVLDKQAYVNQGYVHGVE